MSWDHLKTHTIRGKLYKLIWRKPPGKHPDPNFEYVGQCESPRDRGRELWLWPKQDPKEMLGTIIHEFAHGAFPDLEESAIEEYERDTMRIFTRMGLEVKFNGQ